MPAESIRERAAERVCPNCGKPSPERRSNRGPAPLYCDQACKRAMNNRNLTDGAALVPYLKAWRIDRGSSWTAKGSFARVCKILDQMNEADRMAGRPRADYHARVLMASNAQPVNERRSERRKAAIRATYLTYRVELSYPGGRTQEVEVKARDETHAIVMAKLGRPSSQGRVLEIIAPEPEPVPLAEDQSEHEVQPESDFERILRLIAEGHNDPRRLAEEALGLR